MARFCVRIITSNMNCSVTNFHPTERFLVPHSGSVQDGELSFRDLTLMEQCRACRSLAPGNVVFRGFLRAKWVRVSREAGRMRNLHPYSMSVACFHGGSRPQVDTGSIPWPDLYHFLSWRSSYPTNKCNGAEPFFDSRRIVRATKCSRESEYWLGRTPERASGPPSWARWS
jgi:hypothetical protein